MMNLHVPVLGDFIDKSREPLDFCGEVAESDEIPLSRDLGEILVECNEIWYMDAIMFCVVKQL